MLNTLYNQYISNYPQLTGKTYRGIHYVESTYPSNDPPIVILHGVFSSSYPFLDVAHALSAHRKVYVMDLPGWGISAPIDAKNNTILQSYIYSIIQFLDHVCESKVILVAHSFAGFIATHLVHQYPQRVDRLVLVSPAGLFPINHDTGMYWALFFYTAIHYWIVYYLAWVIRPLLELWTPHHLAHYSLAHLSTRMPAWNMLRSFVHFNLWECRWTNPCVHVLLQSQVPYVFIYGELDTLTPSHHGLFVNVLTRGAIKCFEIPNADHNPHSRLVPFLQTLHDAMAACATTHIRISPPIHYSGSWSTRTTHRRINQMYMDMLAQN